MNDKTKDMQETSGKKEGNSKHKPLQFGRFNDQCKYQGRKVVVRQQNKHFDKRGQKENTERKKERESKKMTILLSFPFFT